jgi:hypothetical protein
MMKLICTNLYDDPGCKKVIAKWECKYPERVLNQSKSSTSNRFAAVGDGCGVSSQKLISVLD